MNQNILLNYFEKVFQYANQPNNQVSNLNDLPKVQFTSFVELEIRDNIMYITINDKIVSNIISLHNKILISLLAASFYKVNLNNKEFIVSGKFLRRFLADLSYTNNEFLKIDQNLLNKLETKVKNAKEIEFLYLFTKNAANIKGITKEAFNINLEFDMPVITDDISNTIHSLANHIKDFLHVPADALYNTLSKILPDAYARFFTGAGLAISYITFTHLILKFVMYLTKNYRGLLPFLPLPFIIVGMATYFAGSFDVIKSYLSADAHYDTDIKARLIIAAIFVGLAAFAGYMQRNTNINDQARNLAAVLQK
ncbi:MAG: hypothetical protein F9Y92_06290 [Thermoplasmatales archaeon]|nr:hypothetical protein [Thermoplasmatales archaeon]